MYESFYRLARRPFAAAPDVDMFVSLPAITEVVERLDRCIRQGRGIAVLIAEPGYGKTQLCHYLARDWEQNYCVAMLPNASFPTRRGLLQAILAELAEPYERLGETELRLKLTATARSVKSRTSGIVLILDEAHRYSDRLLEEIRLISNLFEEGEPLIRILLAGQPALEESLADPGQIGVNERIGEIAMLPRMTAEESVEYLASRVRKTGGDLSLLFDEQALNTLVRACGGNPRCLNQLADHSLLLGYVAESRPVNEGLVLEALDDLKRLPLQWQDPPRSDSAQTEESLQSGDWALPAESANEENIIEIGCLESPFEQDSHPIIEFVAAPIGPRPKDSGTAAAVTEVSEAPSRPESPSTESVQDRFARIDADQARQKWLQELEAEASRPGQTIVAQAVLAGSFNTARESNPLRTLDRIEPLLRAALEEDFADRPDTSKRLDGRGDLEQIISALEKSNCENRAGGEKGNSVIGSTLFRDLRRRDRKSETGQS